MASQFYPAVIVREPHEGGKTYSIQFPDVPGAVSWGYTMAEALVHGREALELALEGETEIPEPTPFDEVPGKFGASLKPGSIVQLVEVVPPEPSVRVNVTMPGDLVKRIDKAAGNYGRSEFLATAAREKLVRDSGVSDVDVLTAVVEKIGLAPLVEAVERGRIPLNAFRSSLKPREVRVSSKDAARVKITKRKKAS